jgi:uncharacterized protein (TIGR01244 family)
MEIRRITEDYAVSPQIATEDVAAISRAGFRSIVCHRPDGEQPGQPSGAEIGAAAAAAGLAFRHIPFVGGQMTEADVAAMAEALAALPGPVFAYCRSGARSTNIFLAARQARA